MERNYLYDLLKQEDLALFIEQTTQTKLTKSGGRYLCRCPMPNHRDSTPSFNVGKNNSVWQFNCFGCNTGGTIIDFYMAYHCLENPYEAMIALAEHFQLDKVDDLLKRSLDNIKVQVDQEAKLEAAHIEAASACRRLLRKASVPKEIEQWVRKSYIKMNTMLESGDIRGIRRIESEALEKL